MFENKVGFLDLNQAETYQRKHGNVYFKERRRPVYVVRGAWNAQAPGTNERIIGCALERLPNIPSILISDIHGCLFFGTPGQCKKVEKLKDTDVLTMWYRKDAYYPIYKSDITHCIAVPTKKGNPYPKKPELDRDGIITKINYCFEEN